MRSTLIVYSKTVKNGIQNLWFWSAIKSYSETSLQFAFVAFSTLQSRSFAAKNAHLGEATASQLLLNIQKSVSSKLEQPFRYLTVLRIVAFEKKEKEPKNEFSVLKVHYEVEGNC